MTGNKWTSFRWSALKRAAPALGFAGLLALTACDTGPDRAVVASDLKSSVEAQLRLLEGSSSRKMLSHTAVNVTAEEDGVYLVSIEGLKIQPAPDGYLDIGTISYLAKPKDEKSYEVSGLKIAPTLPFKGLDGKDRGKLMLTTKAFSGLWSNELGVFQKLDGEFSDISATDDTGGDVRFANAKFAGELADKGGGLFDSIGNLVLSGLVAKDTGSGLFAVSEIRFDGKYDSVKLLEYQAAARKYQELALKQFTASPPANEAAGQPALPSPEDQKAMTAAIAAMAASIKGGDFKATLKDLKYTDAGDDPFTLGALTLGTAIDGINQDKAGVSLDIAYQGLTIDTPEASTALAKGALPKTGNFGLKVTDMPSKDLAKVLADNLPGVMSADSAMAEANATAMLIALQAVMQASGVKIEVTPSGLTSDVTELKADGMFNVTPQSMFGVVGALNLMLRGLDDLVALAQATPDDYDAQQVLGIAQMLSQYSAREQGADGKPVDKFKIELDEGGQILVNGKPM